MALNGIVIQNIVHQLKCNIFDGKIDKIYQPESDEVIISVRTATKSHKLLLSCNANYPRVHLTSISKENPQHAPNFCMVLRKHLQNGKIVDIIQPDFERIIEFHISSIDQFGDRTIKRLIIEMMGKHSNIILVDQSNKVVDSIKHVSHEISRIREVFPGTEYFIPPTTKLNPMLIDFDQFKQLFKDANVDNIADVLMSKFNGFGKVMGNEISYRYSTSTEHSSIIDIINLWLEFTKIVNKIKDNKFTPVLYLDQVNNEAFDFSAINLFHYKDYKANYFESISDLIETFYSQKDQNMRMKHKSETLLKNVQLLLDRNERQFGKLQETILESGQKEKYKIWGDLILANVYSIQKGDKFLETINYYSQDQENIKIALDNQLNPSQNAQKYYKKYNKLRNAENAAGELIENVKNEIQYLESVLVNLQNSTCEDDINLIKFELSEQGYIKKVKNQKKQAKIKNKPHKFISTDNFIIFVGKNNVQNDELTLKIANNNDIWLHTKSIHGSHVIIRTENRELTEDTLYQAAVLAAYYSKGKLSSNVSVDYTTVKNVKKPSGAKPGMVNYFNYTTIVVTPDESIVNKLRVTSD